MSRSSIALVGCGQWGAFILRDLVSLGCEVTVVARSKESRLRAKRGGAQSIVPDIPSIPSVNGIVVATPTSLHAQAVEQCAARDVPIFVEKPLASNSKDARRLCDLLKDRLFVMDKWRYHAGVLDVKDLVSSGRLGSLIGIRTRRVQNGNHHSDVPGVWTYLPHDLAIIFEILGTFPRPRCAVSDRDGSVFTAILGTRPWSILEFSCREEIKERKVTAIFERGDLSLSTEGFASNLIIRPLGGQTEIVRYPHTEPLRDELEDFVDYLEGGPPPKSSSEEGLRMVELIEELVFLSGPGDAP